MARLGDCRVAPRLPSGVSEHLQMLAEQIPSPVHRTELGTTPQHLFRSATNQRKRSGYDGFVELIELGRLNDAQQAELEEGDVDPWGAVGNTLRWRPKDLHVALQQSDGRLVASAGLVLAQVQVGDAPLMQVVGLGGVIVSAPYRGQGLSNRVIAEALRRAATLGPGVAMLFCGRDRAGLYERHGFVEIDPPVMAQQPDGLVEMPMVSMWRPLREDVTLPSGPLTLHGLPF